MRAPNLLISTNIKFNSFILIGRDKTKSIMLYVFKYVLPDVSSKLNQCSY